MYNQNPSLGCLSLSSIGIINVTTEFSINLCLAAYFGIICHHYRKSNPSLNPFALQSYQIFAYILAGFCAVWLIMVIATIILRNKNERAAQPNPYLAQESTEHLLSKFFFISSLLAGTLLLPTEFKVSPLFFSIAMIILAMLHGYYAVKLKTHNDARWPTVTAIFVGFLVEAFAAFGFYLSLNISNLISHHFLAFSSGLGAAVAAMIAFLALFKYCAPSQPAEITEEIETELKQMIGNDIVNYSLPRERNLNSLGNIML